jgi:hypothetical protein
LSRLRRPTFTPVDEISGSGWFVRGLELVTCDTQKVQVPQV